MRLIFGLLMIVAIFHGFYSVSMAVSSYFSLYDAVDRAVAERGNSGVIAVREAILRRAAASGVALDDRKLIVEDRGRLVTVHVRWSYPVLTLQNEPVVSIPLSIDRSYPR